MTNNSSPNPLAYTGLDPVINPQSISVDRAPTITDWQSFYPGDQWRDTSVTPNVWYVLRSVAGNRGDWEAYTGGTGTVVTIIADSGSATPSGGAITVSGGTTGLTTTAAGSTVDLTGTLNVGHGGTGDTTLAANSVLLGNGASPVSSVGPSANAGQVLQNNPAAPPTYSTATYPNTTTANDLLFSSANNVVDQIANGTTGQVLTAQSGAAPIWTGTANITSFSFTQTAAFSGNVYIAASGSGNISLMGIVGIFIFGTDYVHQLMVSVGANQFDNSTGKISILSNYSYDGFTAPISDIFFTFDASQNVYLTITLTTVPSGGASIILSSFSPGSHIQLGNFTPTPAGTMPGYGIKQGLNGSFGLSGGITRFGLDPFNTTNSVFLGNTTAPGGTPTAGGILYVNAGALTYIGSSGTVTIIAPA